MSTIPPHLLPTHSFLSGKSTTTFPLSKIQDTKGTIYNMSNSSSTPSLHSELPISGFNGLSLQEDTHATPTPKDKRCLSESSLNTMTPPNSNQSGAPLAVTRARSSINDRKDSMFIKAQEGDDVFGRNLSVAPSQIVKQQSVPTTAILQDNTAVPSQVPFQQTPRIDRMSSPITAANAQGLLPAEACLFIANLATSRDDSQLELACHDHFDFFGNCYIKVRRDKHRHPFALVQYHNIEDSNNAIRASRDIVIDGRNIRVEHAQARRSVIVTKVDGGSITVEEAKEVLENYGPISQVHLTSGTEARDLGMPEGVWVQFTYYLDYKDAVKSFNTNTSEYRIHVPPEVEARTTSHPAPTTGSPMVRGWRTPRSSTDQKSIFVGNLPPETTEQDLRRIFCDCGVIRAINVIHKEIHGGSGINTFGFIEFSNAGDAATAANMEVDIQGSKIRVEPKEYSARRHVRLSNFSPAMSPFYYGQRHAFNPLWNNANAPPTGFKSNYYPMQSPLQQNGGYNDMSPYQHHQSGLSSAWSTPPPSTRNMPRRNDMLFTGSPHHMPQWSPFVPSSLYAGMMQIPEEMEGQQRY